ncbi:MAG TPA: DoxX family protein [Bacteroidia bacterium]|nr:DoxX family protein [Bacteroidia bacterium]
MKSFPFLTSQQFLLILRITLGLFMMAHGTTRLYVNSLEGFGEFLNSKGFIIGYFLAWSVTIFDIAGGALLATGYFTKIICMAFIFVLLMGIILVHFQNGWFVVGHQSGGIEYSVLLIICLLLTASSEKK